MRIKSLKVNDLRNIKHFCLNTDKVFNIIYGENGSGKTTVLEALHILSTGKSFRSSKPETIISYGKKQFSVFVSSVDHNLKERSFGIARQQSGEVNIKIDTVPSKRISDLALNVLVQVISPDSISLLVGGPSERRKYLDYIMFHVEPSYYKSWQEYKKILQQRNNLLKTYGYRVNPKQLEAWDKQFIDKALIVITLLQVQIESILSHIKIYIKKMINLDIDISYAQGFQGELNLSALEKLRSKELASGSSQIGPHKSDLLLTVQGQPADKLLSRGQSKLLVCALILAQASYVYKKTQKKPVFLLDDLPSELDENAREKVYQAIKSMDLQAFVTGIELNQLLPRDKSIQSSVFSIANGCLEECDINSTDGLKSLSALFVD